ncbi:Omp28-related outer membrane protein [Prevotella falsenii]|uniref:Omp28-related outer membrane protein n=1 Tax=Prevotella falsenii TaxID=515414 RepID=UPI0004683A41|nr:Omp28-related outer membrane protein [Prevotella falsenii]
MNSIRKSIFLLSLASLPFTGGGLFAQTANENPFKLGQLLSSNQSLTAPTSGEGMHIGYCTTEVSRGLIAQITGSHTYHAAAHYPPELLNKYVGDKIDAIEFAIKPKRGQRVEYFICTDLDYMKETTLAKGSSKTYTEGWNKMKFSNPVTIKKDMDLYIGYMLYLNDGEAYDCILFDESPYSVVGKNWYGYDGNWYNNTTGIDKNLCIRVAVSGDNIPNNDISLMKLTTEDGSEFVEQNMPKSYMAYIQNNGITPINSLTVTVSAKGVQSKEITLNGFNVPNNIPQQIILDNIPIPAEGNYTATFTVTKVNGTTDPDMSDNSKETKGFAIKEGTKPVERTVLFEEFSSEGYDECATADELYSNVLNPRKDVIRVKHHLDYKEHKDQFRIPQDTEYEQLYGKSKTFVPAIAADRIIVTGLEDPGPAYFIANEEEVAKFLDLAKSQYSFVTLKAEPQTDANGNKLNVKISGHAGTNEMPLQTDLRLTTWLVEDSIKSTQQQGKDVFVQNGVIRAVLSGNAWGDALDISGYDFEKTYSVNIKPEWNVNNMRVVSFVSNYNADVAKRTVYNTTQAFCSSVSGITSHTYSPNNAFRVVNGSLIMSQGYQLVGIYDIAGRKVSTGQLGNGLYVVKATNGAKVITKKIHINR